MTEGPVFSGRGKMPGNLLGAPRRASEYSRVTRGGSSSDISRPLGGYNPSFHATPQPSDVQRGLSGGSLWGVYVIVMEGVINNNKMLMYKIWSFYSQEYC